MVVIKALRKNRTVEDIKKSSTTDPCREFLNVWDNLAVMDDKEASLITMNIQRLVIPQSERQRLLEIIHTSHQGQVKTFAAAKSCYY